MASDIAPSNPSALPQEDQLRVAARATVFGLGWGALMLVMLALWQWARNPDAALWLPVVLALLGVAALGLMLWHALALFARQDAAAHAATLSRQRRPLGLALVGGGLTLLVLDLFLAFHMQPTFGIAWDNFGAAVGLLFFAVIALSGGCYLLGPPGREMSTDLAGLRRRLTLVKIGLILTSVLAIGTLAYLKFYVNADLAYFPEYFALTALSLLASGAFFWLTIGSPDELDAFHLRVFVLTLGGGAGLILFFLSLGRAYVWRNEIFLGGMTAWQGDHAWRIWLVAYLQLAALALMFSSLSLARGDVRANPVLRRLLFGYNTVLSGLLVVEILLIVNVVFYALVPYTFDWTAGRGVYGLSEASKNLLGGLKKETHVFVLLPTGHEVYADVKLLIDNSQAQTNRLKVDYISPDTQPNEYEKLSRLFPKILPDSKTARVEESGRGLLLVYGALPKDEKHTVPYTFIAERKLYEVKQGMARGDKPKRIFKGEGEFMKELNFLTRNQQKRKIYFLQGDAESDINALEPSLRRDMRVDLAQVGMGVFADQLKKENYEISGLSFAKPLAGAKVEKLVYAKEGSDKKKEVPDDAYALVIAGASRPMAPETLAGLELFLDRGGRLMVFLDVFAEADFSALKSSGIEAILNRYGLKIGPDFALRVAASPREQPTTLLATPPLKSDNTLVKQFWGQSILLPRSARIIRAADTPGRYHAEVLLELNPQVSLQGVPNLNYAESKVAVLREPLLAQAEMRQSGELLARLREEPIPVAMAVYEKETEKPRLVVFGDTEFITNAELMRNRLGETNYNLAVSALEWMAEREGFVGPRPKESSVYIMAPTVDPWRMILLPGWLMLMTLLGLGTGIYLVRRR